MVIYRTDTRLSTFLSLYKGTLILQRDTHFILQRDTHFILQRDTHFVRALQSECPFAFCIAFALVLQSECPFAFHFVRALQSECPFAFKVSVPLCTALPLLQSECPFAFHISIRSTSTWTYKETRSTKGHSLCTRSTK